MKHKADCATTLFHKAKNPESSSFHQMSPIVHIFFLGRLSLSFILMFQFLISREGGGIYNTYFHLKFPVLSKRQYNLPLYLII